MQISLNSWVDFFLYDKMTFSVDKVVRDIFASLVISIVSMELIIASREYLFLQSEPHENIISIIVKSILPALSDLVDGIHNSFTEIE